MYSELWLKALKSQVDHDYKQFKNVKITEKDVNAAKKDSKSVIIEIENNVILSGIIGEDPHSRQHSMMQSFNLGIQYSIDNKLPPISGKYHVRFTDGYAFEHNYPTFSFSKPKSKKGFLIPDFNFFKYKDKMKDFKKNCNGEKINEIYFKGSDTTKRRSKLRGKISVLPKPFNVSIDGEYAPYYNICNYKYVLDLCGTKPWSVRLIELYMSKSMPIRVLLYNKKWGEERWIQFYENMFLPWESYANLEYDTHYDREIANKDIKDVQAKSMKIMKYFDKNKDHYDEIVQNNYNKVKALKMEYVGYYMYHASMAYNRVVSDIRV